VNERNTGSPPTSHFALKNVKMVKIANIKPLFDRVLVRIAQADSVSAGGIVLPESAKEKAYVGSVSGV